MGKKIVATYNAPQAIGPYSQGIEIESGKMIFTSGQIPINPETDEIPEGIVEQTRQSLKNLKGILEEAGVNLDNLVKTTVYLKDMNDFQAMNKVYEEFFNTYPARSAIEVARLPKDVLIEIEGIAIK